MHASYSAKVLNLAHRNWERNDSGCGAGHISRSHTSTPMVGQQNNVIVSKNSWSELEITGGVSNLSPGVFDYIHLTRLSLRCNNLAILPKQISNLINLLILDASGNRLQSIPAEMGKMITLKELYLNNNCLKNLPFELGKLFQLQKLGIKGNPLPNKYFNFCNEVNGTQKLINFLFDHLPTSCTTVPERHWVPLDSCDSSKPLVFSILSYNVLCDKNCTRQLYPYCQSWALSWDYRKKIIIGELRRYQADILCLQEVETDQFYQFFQPELSKEGYSGIFSPKSRAKTMQENERKHVDGCAIFYKSAKFQVVSERLVEFNQIAIEAAGGSHDMINRVMTKDNIGLAVLLQTTKEAWLNGLPPDVRVNQPLLVATCHVHWDPEFCDVKIIQTMMLIKELKNIIKGSAPELRPSSANEGKLDCTSVPMVICGDMNSVPESGVVEFLKLGQVNSNHKEFKEMAYKDCLLKLSTSTDKEIYTHNFRLKEAYLKDTLPFTNFTYDFKDIIDYIFFSYDTIRCLGVLGSPDDKWFESNNVVGCPHPQIPSDHLPLLAQLMILPSPSFLFSPDGQQHHHHHFHVRP